MKILRTIILIPICLYCFGCNDNKPTNKDNQVEKSQIERKVPIEQKASSSLLDKYKGPWQSEGQFFLEIARTLAQSKTDKGCGEFYYIQSNLYKEEFLVCCMPSDTEYNLYIVDHALNTVRVIKTDSSLNMPR